MTEDRKKIFVEEILNPAAKETEGARMWSLITRQYEMCEFIQEQIAKGVSFDPKTHLANHWILRPETFLEIFIDPKLAYGQPIIPALVPTRTIMDAWISEEQNINAVADWSDIPVTEASQAVDFERALSQSKQALTARPGRKLLAQDGSLTGLQVAGS